MELAKETLAAVKAEIASCRAEFRAIPEGKRRNGIPVGKWAHQRQALNIGSGSVWFSTEDASISKHGKGRRV